MQVRVGGSLWATTVTCLKSGYSEILKYFHIQWGLTLLPQVIKYNYWIGCQGRVYWILGMDNLSAVMQWTNYNMHPAAACGLFPSIQQFASFQLMWANLSGIRGDHYIKSKDDCETCTGFSVQVEKYIHLSNVKNVQCIVLCVSSVKAWCKYHKLYSDRYNSI